MGEAELLALPGIGPQTVPWLLPGPRKAALRKAVGRMEPD